MYKILINDNITTIFKDNNLDGIDKNDVIGFLINDDSITNLISLLPIRKYYKNSKEGYREITKDEMLFIYNGINTENKEIISEELKSIKIEDTRLFLIDKKNSIYKALLNNNINNVYDLFNKTNDVLSMLSDYENDKGEFIAIIKMLKYKYLGYELDFNLDDTFKRNKGRRSWKDISYKLQSIGIPKIITYSYGNQVYNSYLYEDVKLIDIINSISSEDRLIYCYNTYQENVYDVAKNRVNILLEYYNKKSNKQKVLSPQ